VVKFMVDIKKPPRGPFRLENLYVILSRASCWEDIAILRQFDPTILQGEPNQQVVRHDKQLDFCNTLTKERYERL
jgi:hypothetical protein